MIQQMICKYETPLDGVFEIEVPEGGVILSIQIDQKR